MTDDLKNFTVPVNLTPTEDTIRVLRLIEYEGPSAHERWQKHAQERGQ